MLRWCRRLLPALLICAALPLTARAQAGVKPEELVKQGIALEKESKFDEARARYLKAIELKPKYAEASFRLGRLYLEIDSLTQAEQYLLRAKELRYDGFQTDRHLARVYFRQGKFAPAIELYRELVRRKPKQADIRFELAEVYYANDNLEEALLEDSVALRLDPGNIEEIMLHGRIKARQRDFDAARADYRQVIARNPQYAPAYQALGDLFKFTDVDSAIHYYRRYVALEPVDALGNFNLSGLYYNLSQKDFSGLTPPANRSDTQALRAYVRARDSVNLPLQAAYSESAMVYVKQAKDLGLDREDVDEFYVKVARESGNRAGVITALKTFLEVNPTQPLKWALLGQVLADSGDIAQSIYCYKQAAVYDSTMRRRTYAWIASQYYKQKQYDSSIVYNTRVTEIDPTAASAYMNRAYAWLYGKNDRVRGLADVEKAIQVDPKRIDFRVFLMKYHYGNKEWDTAYRVAREILEIAPDTEDARNVKNNIDAMRAALKRKAEEEEE